MSRIECNAAIKEWGREITGTVLSIGSGMDTDRNGRRYRDYFPNASRYVTSEPTKGPCDLILDARAMPSIPDESVDAVFCSGVLEHIDDCHAAVREVWRVLKRGGLFVVGVPFAQPLHRVPDDFWRFTEYGLRFLLRAFHVEQLRAFGPVATPYAYMALARKA